ncbi:MAG: ECF-type sigma factor [Pirellulaceae bacterium]|nr:helix-turn-helix domain-containing protein [Planctomycetales bacterium]
MSSGSVTNWIDLFKSGDEEAARQLWSRYFSPLVGVARSKLGQMTGVNDAEDVALSAFHTLYRAAAAERLPEMTDREGLWQSLLVITTGKVIDAKRKELSQKRGGGQVRAELLLADFLRVDQPDPALAASLAEEFNRLLHLLGDRELLEIALLKMEGYTNCEIATRLNCGERTIKRRLALIRRIWEESGVAPVN